MNARALPWLLILAALGLLLWALPRSNVMERLSPGPAVTLSSNEIFRTQRPTTFRIERRGGVLGEQTLGIGTGFFIDPDGTALTAYHVVEGGQSFQALTPGGRRYPLQVVGFDAQSDLAVLKVKARGPVQATRIAHRTPRVGERVLAIGNSNGEFLQRRSGRLLRLDVEAIRADFPAGTLELDAPLAPGDSGGPIFDAAGEVIGVVSYIRLQNEELTSYAIPVRADAQLLADLRAGEKRDVPIIGFTTFSSGGLPPEGYRELGLQADYGVIVGEVTPGGPAERAGLRSARSAGNGVLGTPLEADVITAVDGHRTRDYDELVQVVRQKRIGQQVTLTVQRGSQTLKIRLRLGARADVVGR
ncbi:S1-C subfamily serine protease [Deinobacterium chartae]|uniref:S1-C subfamily serine protease n=1 Tax=Deinobacterium chartae TaxID=521158 RepID=A0A841I3Z3_9DEIO|nr:S1C family serine protease [Deinobacterium chartae]MBB6099756.1 S1-C subfamily serine protease [Deinobacterium chartae]